MASPFVPVPFPVSRFGSSRSRSKRGSPTHTNSSSKIREPSASESSPLVTGHGPWCSAVLSSTPDETWSRFREGGRLDGSSTPLQGEGSYGESLVERPIIPTLLGYEILEERAKFTVYKIRVTGSQGDSWVVFRRYTDFCRLSDKLKEFFPSFRQALPPKRWFKDNYDEDFLEERRTGLQTFLQDVTSHADVFRSEAVRHFLCLIDPPSPFDSLEESRAFCETLEETNHHLQRELLEKQKEVDTLKKTLEERQNHIDLLLKKIESLSLSSETFEGPCERTVRITTDRGDTDVNGHEQINGKEDDGRGYPN